MKTQIHPLESYFHEIIRDTCENKLGMDDQTLVSYLARLLAEFSVPDNIYRLHDAKGRRLELLTEMVHASDPVYGTASSFVEERTLRKYVGDYALFVSGMCYDVVKSAASSPGGGPTLAELIATGKESYYIVSQFNVFEFEKEAPLYLRLCDEFERSILALAFVREELAERKLVPAA